MWTSDVSALAQSRRHFLREGSLGLGAVALAALSGGSTNAMAAAAQSLTPMFAPRAKHVIYLFMAGGPSQLDFVIHGSATKIN